MPHYADALLDEIRNSVNIVSVVSEYVALRRRGRNHVARCPFHVEKTPSFNVNEERQIFMCFGCGVGGDVFKFLMQIEHITFPQAVRMLAERQGIPLPEASSDEEPQEGTDPGILRAAMLEAARYFHRTLLDPAEGRGPLSYLRERGISEDTIGRFTLGYSPAGGASLLEFLKTKGYRCETLEECGLVKKSEDGRNYDAFRGRIMFPITDIQGRVIAFGGRALGERQPKYLNSPDTRIYNKSRNLFGMSHSREDIKKEGFAVLVEGYMDFIIPYQHGAKNLVASLGTSLTAQQVKLLGRYTRDVVVSYDPDAAGLAATQRSLDLFLEEDFQVRVFRLPAGEDPDTFVRKAGVEQYCTCLRQAVPYLDFVLDTAIRGQRSLADPKSKIQVLNAVLPYLARIPHAVERSEYVFRFAQRLKIDDGQLLAEVKRAARQRKNTVGGAAAATAEPMKFAEKRLLQLLLNRAELQEHILPACSEEDFEGLVSGRIFRAILSGYRRGTAVTFESLHREIAGNEEQSLLAQLQLEEMPEDLSLASAESFLNALRTARLLARRQELISRIAEAADRHDELVLNQLIEERVLVDRELVVLSRR